MAMEILARPIQLADQVTKDADSAQSFKEECIELKTKTEKLAPLLLQAVCASTELYEQPTRRIIDQTEQVLHKALTLVSKCRYNGFIVRILFTIIPPDAFKNTSTQLENSILDLSWLLRISAPVDDRDVDAHIGLPPIASNDPILGLIWEQVAIIHTRTLDERSDAAASLASLARDNDRYGRLIIEEGGVGPLLKLAKEGKMEGQENAARCIGFLGRNSKSVEHIVNCGACSVFAKILEDGHMKVQSVVAWAVSEMAAQHPKCQHHFSHNNVINLLVTHLAFETIQEHTRYEEDDKQIGCGNQLSSKINNVVNNTLTKGQPNTQQELQNSHEANHQTLSGASINGREYEDPATKVQMKAMTARALWHLCKGNVTICRNITESNALLCFAVLLEKGPEDVKYYSAMALMEITAMAEQNVELRQSGFKPTSPVVKIVVEQFLKEDCDLIISSIKTIGHLAWTFKATETRMIAPLVKLLDERVGEIVIEAVIALDKFACPDNCLHENHCKAIIEAGGTKALSPTSVFW